MTNKELKMYAISGILVRIKHEEKKLKKAKDKNEEIISRNIEKLKKDYTELINTTI